MKAAKELKGFEKILLKPAEEGSVEIELQAKDFAYYDENSSKWIVEPGEYNLLIGASSRDIKFEIPIMIK